MVRSTTRPARPSGTHEVHTPSILTYFRPRPLLWTALVLYRNSGPDLGDPTCRSTQGGNDMSLFSHRAVRAPFLAAVVVAVAASTAGLPPASAALEQGQVVIEDPVNYTPSLVAVDGQQKPIVDAMAGLREHRGRRWPLHAGQPGRVTSTRNYLMLFDANDGDLRDPVDTNGRVWAAASSGDWIYVGGTFGSASTVSRPSTASRASTPPPARSTRASPPRSGAGSTCWSSPRACCTPAAPSRRSWSR